MQISLGDIISYAVRTTGVGNCWPAKARLFLKGLSTIFYIKLVKFVMGEIIRIELEMDEESLFICSQCISRLWVAPFILHY